MAKDVQRRLAAILAADVVGSSRLMQDDELGTLAALRAHREALIEPKIAEHEGRIVKLMGDGLLMEFASVVNAVLFAADFQGAMAKWNARNRQRPQIAYRIGINLGDIIVEGEDIFGDGVIIAVRLEGMAEPGGICISGQVYAQVKGKIDLSVEDLGERRIKNVDEPVHTFAVRAVEGGDTTVAWSRQGEAARDRPSVVVLPFVTMSADAEQAFLADSLTEDVITGLSQSQDLLVVARSSAEAFKGKALKAQEIAADLGVQYLVQGSLRSEGKRLRITVRLVDAASGGHLWAERFDRALDDLSLLEDEIVDAVVQIVKDYLKAANLARRIKAHQGP